VIDIESMFAILARKPEIADKPEPRISSSPGAIRSRTSTSLRPDREILKG